MLSQRLAHCFQQTEQNISEFVLTLHCFLLSEYWYTQAIFQNNISVMLLTSSFPTVLLGEQSEESCYMA